ncbi:PaaI family thioesterase [Corynebacterium tapiri]|uniref:PaaI family thioesterase n=1 Tax=Corynebacterium tapiri TaxID=1448266 RepID=A0A5C4U3Z5_9CORY|nr:PaaI family thioesterase [Corynebacterium tapiri]TNL97636.1 PaaI family thioesterase [Corynebacterium tapiri]
MTLLDALGNLPLTQPLTPEQLETLNAHNGGLDQTIHLRYCHIAPRCVRARLSVDDSHLQPAGLVHGGVYASMAESVGSLASVVTLGEPVVGANNSTDFLAAVSSGDIEAEATPIHVGRRTQLWRIECTQNGRVVAVTTLRTLAVNSK